jgi:hypothetical protein
MAYPDLPIHPDSRRLVRDGRDETQAVNGSTYVRRFYSQDQYDFELVHPALNVTQMTSLTDFYAANMGTTFSFYWPEDQQNYTVQFGRGGIDTKWRKPNYRDARVRLVGVGPGD